MSRYSVKRVNKEGTELEINYGFDHALGYWYELWDHTLGDEDWQCCIEQKSSYPDRLHRGDFIVFMNKYHLPDEHKTAVGLDLPF
jgi:hypothetical protein|tara:strand:+ start:1074 stop:1328 length:255 start_codon:yes stop_codon:yes gene_type:complete